VSTPPDLEQRYGRPSPSRRRTVIAVSGFVGVVALAWVVWAAWVQSTPQVQSSLRTFSVADPHAVKASVAVQLRKDGVRATCVVQATASDHTTVGQLTFVVTGHKGTTDHDLTMRTEREAVAVDVVGCTTPHQKKPR
jgi:hypothetical protein